MAKKNSKEKTKHSIGFSVKNNKRAPERMSEVSVDKLTKKQIIILISVTLAALIVSGIIIGAVAASRISSNPDFMTYDLSKYITIDRKDYTEFTIDIPLDEPTEDELVRRVNILRTSKKTLSGNGGFEKSYPLSLGDQAYIYYRGYTVGEDGRQTDFAGSSNFASDDPTIIEVGTGNVFSKEDGSITNQFIPGFAEQLLGLIPIEMSQFSKITEGAVSGGDVIYLSYTVIGEGGDKLGVTSERIDLSLSYIDEIYGEGFTEFFTGKSSEAEAKTPKKIGEAISGEHIFRIKGHSTDTVYSDMKIDFVTRCEKDPYTITVRFPASYSEKSLRGVETKFDVYVKYAEMYDVPEFNDAYIKDTLKFDTSKLDSYKGETLADKYKAMLKAEIEKDVEDSNFTLLEEALYEHLLSKTTVKALPADTVDSYYNSYLLSLEQAYSTYKNSYDSIEDFAEDWYGISNGNNYKYYLKAEAEAVVTEKIIFYYIMRDCDLMPSTAEYNKLYQELYSEILDYYLELHEEEFSKLEGEEYDKELEILKSEIDNYYGEEYFRESVYYEYCTKKLLENATVTRQSNK